MDDIEQPQAVAKVAALAALKATRLRHHAAAQAPDAQPQGTAAQDAQHGMGTQPRTQRSWVWNCSSCMTSCIPIRTESRCLCGHRLKDHGKLSQTNPMSTASRCSVGKCTCQQFYYIVAEGSWVLHCRCKHKHTDHDPVTRRCNKPSCKGCDRFHSPWVCNCNHPWSDHVQEVIEHEVKSLEQLMAEACVAEDVNRHDLIHRGLD